MLAAAALIASCGGHPAPASDSARPARQPSVAPRPAAAPDGDWATFDYTSSRSGSGPARTGITAHNATSLVRRVIAVDGVVDSAPIQLHAIRVGGRVRDVVVVTTTYGRTIAFDPRAGAKLWEFVPADIGSYVGSAQITTASPVADPGRSYVYSASPDGVIHKLKLATGRQVWAARITFDAAHEKIAGALNISGGDVVAVTGGYYGDAPSYQGHVALIDRASGRVAHVFNSLCSNRHSLIGPPSSCPASGSAIWARAGAVVAPHTRRLLVATGNGPFNGTTDWGDSVLELSPDASRLLHSWTPTNEAQLEATDTDVGSTGPALLPGGVAVQGGKDGELALLDPARLGVGRTGGELQRISSPGGGEVLTAPAVWRHGGATYVFVADDSGTAAYRLSRGRLGVAWQDGSAGTSPVVAGGLLFVYDEMGGTLRIIRPQSGLQIAALAAAPGHWNSPIVVGGRVILPVGGGTLGPDRATSGTVLIYHLAGR
jgi:outer membrane protein assembly factor BamB